MRRRIIEPRADWKRRVETLGLSWHTADDGRAYWDESAYWTFTSAQIDLIEEATSELYEMVLAAVDAAVAEQSLEAFGYDTAVAALITESWNNRGEEPTFYARFDFAFDGRRLKMLELNGDTPTSLLEAAVIQWAWLEERYPHLDQFNSIHDKLVAAFDLYREHIDPAELHLTSAAPHAEDEGTIAYIAQCANDAGVPTRTIAQQDIGWRLEGDSGGFVDLDSRPIRELFKLIPWEWLLDDPFGRQLIDEVRAGGMRLIEPAWKMLASNKRLLVTLKEMFPESPYLLHASMDEDVARGWGDFVKKPLLGREGANVEIVERGQVTLSVGGAYAQDSFVFQEKAALAQADDRYAVIGSWVVNREAAGIGIRESAGPITGNAASFVPHVIEN